MNSIFDSLTIAFQHQQAGRFFNTKKIQQIAGEKAKNFLRTA